MRYVYQSEGGGTYWDIEDVFANCVSFKKLIVGKTPEQVHERILAYLATFCGEFHYRTCVDSKMLTPITLEQIAQNLKQFKRDKEINLHCAQRPSGAFDVLHEILQTPYSTSRFTVALTGKFFIISDSLPLQEITDKLCKIFAQQGYFKTWRTRPHDKPIAKGLAPFPIWDITYIDPRRYRFR